MQDHVIILGGSITALGLVRAYAQIGLKPIVFYQHFHEPAPASKYTYKAIKIADPEKDEKGYLKALIDRGKEWKGTLIIPTSDATVLFASRHKKTLERFYAVSSPDFKAAKIFIEKENTYALCEKLDVPHPKTFYPENEEDLRRVIDIIPLPAIIKPCVSHRFVADFNTKLFKVDTREELKDKFMNCVERGHRMIVQEYIRGDDEDLYGIYTYYDKKRKHVQSMCFHKVRCTPPRFGVVRVVKNHPMVPAFEKGIRTLFDHVGYTGMGFADFKFDKTDNTYKLIEVNPRFVLHCSLHTECGLNYPLMVYKDLVKDERYTGKPKKKVLYWVNIYTDLLNVLSGADKHDSWTLKDYLHPYRENHTHAVISLDDPLPFLKELALFPHHMIRTLKKWIINTARRIPAIENRYMSFRSHQSTR